MKRIEFLKGSAIIGASLAVPGLISVGSGLFAAKGERKVASILSAHKDMVQSVPILRAFAGNQTDYVSPFVLFDEFGPLKIDAQNEGFKIEAHPHAGVIPTTYLISGSGHHKDSIDNDIIYEQGQYMMFSSGRGAIHEEASSETIKQTGGIIHGFQIWLNMPAKHKFDIPATYIHDKKEMPIIENDHYKFKVVIGEIFGKKSATETLSPTFYYHITLKPNGRLEVPTDPSHNAFAYAINGSMEIENKRELKTNQIALYQRGESRINFYSQKGCEFLLLGGQPLNEPVYSYGPFVMNNRAQIEQCYKNYQSGKMGWL